MSNIDAKLADTKAALNLLGVNRVMGKWTDEASRMLPFIRKGVQTLADEEALQIKSVYPQWEDLVKMGKVETDEPGYKFLHGEDLYRCINPNPTFQAEWIPGETTASMYTRIDETHAGTIDDPIPAEAGLLYKKDLYYLEGETLYLCIRQDTDEGTTLHFLPSALVGNYFEIA